MKKLALLLAISLLLIGFGCTSHPYVKREVQQTNIMEKKKLFANLSRVIIDRGYMTLDELQETSDSLDLLRSRGQNKQYEDYLLYPEVHEVLVVALQWDLLPFKAMFYLALEKENYDEAEHLRMTWLNWLLKIEEHCRPLCVYVYGGRAKYLRAGITCPDVVKIKISYDIQKLTSVVGLTDPMLVTLRKELMLALKKKNLDDVQKIQSIITARVSELRPPPQIVQTPSGQTAIIVPQESSTKHVQVEQIPRYGATDVGRAISLLQGKGGGLTDKEAGTLKLIDILLKR